MEKHELEDSLKERVLLVSSSGAAAVVFLI